VRQLLPAILDTMATAKRIKRGVRCEACGKIAPEYDTVTLLSEDRPQRCLCNACRNHEVAERLGIANFQHPNFEPVSLPDSKGKVHHFRFCTRLFGPGVAIEAVEFRRGERRGYEFEVIGDPREDLFALFGRLLEKMRRGLALRHLTQDTYGLRIGDEGVVRARIGYDKYAEGLPLLTIDGREITWHDLGRMLLTYEGWQFQLRILDMSEEL